MVNTLLVITVITVMPTMAYLVGDVWNIIKKDFGLDHWFTQKRKGDLL